jgi:hypothetical protein
MAAQLPSRSMLVAGTVPETGRLFMLELKNGRQSWEVTEPDGIP